MIGEIQIKVIIRDGIVEAALCDDTRLPINIEVVDVDKGYDDYKELLDYAESLYCNPKYAEISLTIADFTTSSQEEYVIEPWEVN